MYVAVEDEDDVAPSLILELPRFAVVVGEDDRGCRLANYRPVEFFLRGEFHALSTLLVRYDAARLRLVTNCWCGGQLLRFVAAALLARQLSDVGELWRHQRRDIGSYAR